MNTPLSYVGQPIRSLQTMLRTLAHADETLLKLVPDGIYGPNTVQAVREFQRQNGLPVTGETDYTTWNKLVAIYTVQSPSVLPPHRSRSAGRRTACLPQAAGTRICFSSNPCSSRLHAFTSTPRC